MMSQVFRAGESRGEGDVELQPARLQPLAGGARFLAALVGKPDIAPAGEQVLQVPFALPMTDEHESAWHMFRSFGCG
jgi:hypothetical protein